MASKPEQQPSPSGRRVSHHVKRGQSSTSVHGFVLDVRRARAPAQSSGARARSMVLVYHSALVDAQVPFEFSLGLKNGDRNHGLRDEAMQSVHRVGHRKAAMQASQSITSTSTVRRGGLSTSTMGVGSLSARTFRHHPGRGGYKCNDQARTIEPLACMPLFRLYSSQRFQSKEHQYGQP